jgi:hypothetical protein
MAERERAVAFTIPWNCEAGPAKSEELMPWQQFQRPVAFDSTFIEVTTDIEDILENLRDRFGGTLVVAYRHDALRISRGQGRRLSQDPIARGPRTRPQQKTPPPRREAAFCLIMKSLKRNLCPWQAWQRPTLPGLKP